MNEIVTRTEKQDGGLRTLLHELAGNPGTDLSAVRAEWVKEHSQVADGPRRQKIQQVIDSLSVKPEIVALNKIDAVPKAELAKKRAALEKACKHEVYAISGVSGAGITTVLRALAKEIQQRRAQKSLVKTAKPVKTVKVARKKKESWAP